MQKVSHFSTSKIPSSNGAKMSWYIFHFSRFIIQAENCFSRLTRNPDEMAKLHQAAIQCRKDACELEIIFFFFPFSHSRNFYPSVFPRDTSNTTKPRFTLIPEGIKKSAHASQLVMWNSIWVERQNWAADKSHPCLSSNVWLRVVLLSWRRIGGNARGGYFSRC